MQPGRHGSGGCHRDSVTSHHWFIGGKDQRVERQPVQGTIRDQDEPVDLGWKSGQSGIEQGGAKSAASLLPSSPEESRREALNVRTQGSSGGRT
jgi:hypothetical protein